MDSKTLYNELVKIFPTLSRTFETGEWVEDNGLLLNEVDRDLETNQIIFDISFLESYFLIEVTPGVAQVQVKRITNAEKVIEDDDSQQELNRLNQELITELKKALLK